MFPDHVNPRLLSCHYNHLNCNNYSRVVVTSMLFPQIELNFHLSESLLHNVSKGRTIEFYLLIYIVSPLARQSLHLCEDNNE